MKAEGTARHETDAWHKQQAAAAAAAAPAPHLIRGLGAHGCPLVALLLPGRGGKGRGGAQGGQGGGEHRGGGCGRQGTIAHTTDNCLGPQCAPISFAGLLHLPPHLLCPLLPPPSALPASRSPLLPPPAHQQQPAAMTVAQNTETVAAEPVRSPSGAAGRCPRARMRGPV